MYRHLHADREIQFRANLLLSVLLVIDIVAIGVILYFAFVANLQMEAMTQRWALRVIGIAELFYLTLTALLVHGYFSLARLGTILVALGSIGIAVLFTGGAPSSPALPLLLLAAVISFCLLGAKWGSLVATAIPTLMALQWYGVQNLGLRIATMRSFKNPVLDAVLINVVNYVLVITVLLVYEYVNAKLRYERDQERERLAHFATHDELTGLANRRHFLQRLEESCARSDRGGHQVALLYLDLDGFKKINDGLGHHSGDAALKQIAIRLRDMLRRQDLVARLGGDEFAIIIDPFKSHQEIEDLCQRLRQAVAQPLLFDGQEYRLGASVGVALYPTEVADVKHVLNQADAAMYAEKRRHRPS